MSLRNHTDESGKRPQKQVKGFISPRFVNGLAFTIITICILIGVAASIMAIWEYADKDTLLRTIGTVAVIILGTFLFAAVNRSFGA